MSNCIIFVPIISPPLFLQALTIARSNLEPYSDRVVFVHGSYADIKDHLVTAGAVVDTIPSFFKSNLSRYQVSRIRSTGCYLMSV